MRRAAWVLALALLGVRPVGAATMLYAAAAAFGRIDAYCLLPDGSLPATPTLSVSLNRANTRRLLVANEVLYVAGVDGIEAFRIGGGGGITRDPSRYRATEEAQGADFRDLAVSADGTTLYATQNARNRIIAYRLDADGLPERTCSNDSSLACKTDTDCGEDNKCLGFFSCVGGPADVGYEDLRMDGSNLFVSADGPKGNRIDVFGTLADGSLCSQTDTGCEALLPNHCRLEIDTDPEAEADGMQRPEPVPLLRRRRLKQPGPFVIANGMIYVQERGLRAIRAFPVAGLVPPPPAGEPKPPPEPPAASRTTLAARYKRIVLHNNAILGTRFSPGRVDAYRLREDGVNCPPGQPPCRLPKVPKTSTDEGANLNPVGMVATGNLAYVAGGVLDRVRAYLLGAEDGLLTSPRHFSQTDALANSFPNDVALAVLSDECVAPPQSP